MPSAHRRARGRLLAAAGLLLIAALTLVPHPEALAFAERTPIWCLVCGNLGAIDVLFNVVLFVPYGAGLRLAGLSRRRLLALVLATTLAVEMLQYTIITGRDASLSDVLTNTTGGLLGALAVPVVAQLLAPGPRLRRVLLGGWTALWLGLLALTALSERRALPRSTYYGQYAADFAGFARFRGAVLEARVDARPIPGRRLSPAEGAAVRAALLADSVTIEATAVTAGPPGGENPHGVAPIFSIFDEHQREIVMLAQQEGDLFLRLRTRAAAFRVRTPMALRLPRAIADSGDTVRLAGTYAHGRLRLALAGPGGERGTELVLTPSLGWAMLLPFEYIPGPDYRAPTMAWLFVMLVPLGYWGRRRAAAGESRALPLLAAALGIAGPALVARAFGLPAPAWWEWAAAAAGAAAGRLLAGWCARTRRRRPAPPLVTAVTALPPRRQRT
ncbi:MAG TPA: VanZ family protein [Gemmatimonadales bacterium]|nr:VanZ family protein [Gemmatimonadales bacterium]